MGTPGLLIATELSGSGEGVATAAAVAVALASREREGAGPGVLLVEAAARSRRRPTLLSSTSARELEARLSAGELARPAARGRICWAALELDEGWLERLAELANAAGGPVVAHLPPPQWREALDDPGLPVAGGLVRADPREHRHLLALLAAELRGAGIPLRVATRPPGLVGARRALAGLDPGGPAGGRAARIAARLASAGGQALPLVAGLCLVTVLIALALTALGGAIAATSREQRAADLAALSAARSMRDDLPRLTAPALLADGSPNRAHMERAEYLARAEQAAADAARHNQAGPVHVSFPDASEAVPVRARVELKSDPGRWAVAQASPPSAPAAPTAAGDYSGPLATRQGKPMRPDVAEAFDRLADAAAKDGIGLLVNSAYRSDAEQARLFAANPDPRWVARPGTSLHRCGTELDLGPPGAYAWLAQNAPRFGFVKRYEWEDWHFGYERGPPPCSQGANAGSGDGGPPRTLPEFVPSPYRAPIESAAARWGVSAGLLAAQLMAESGFDPLAVSPAGARGIAQFMPATAAAYALRDPFDADAAIDAQAHLMSDLLGQLGQIPLALAAYNAGPAPVVACNCVPPYPETQAYVARILALMGGAGEWPDPLEVRLVA
jgi:hypothetical protein